MTQLAGIPATDVGFNPASEEVQRDPYPHYHWLLRNDTVHRGAMGIWYVSRYADVRAVLNDPRFLRAGIRDFWAQMMGQGPLGEIVRHTILFQDEPDHGRLRALVGPAFAPPRLRALESRIGRIVDELLVAVEPHGKMDVINDLAYPLALTVISEVIGLPIADRARIRVWSLNIGPTLDLMASPEEIVRGQAAMGELVEYLNELISRRGSDPGDDLLGVMLAAHRTGGDEAVTMDEIFSMVLTLIFAGHETVTNQIGNMVLALLCHPSELEVLRRRPELMSTAVEECLRYDSSVQSNSRQLGEDVELAGTTLRRGEFVAVLLGAANRDPAQFADPDRFDITRADVHPMSFGAGMRYCLGAVLARLELPAALRRLVGLRDIRLAVDERELAFQRSTMFRGPLSLPVAFAPA